MNVHANSGWWDRPAVRTAQIRAWSVLAGSLVAVGGVGAVMRLGWLTASLAWTCGVVLVGTWVLCFTEDGVKVEAKLLAEATPALAQAKYDLSGTYTNRFVDEAHKVVK